MSIFGSYIKDNFEYRLERAPDHHWIFRHPTSDDEIFIERLTRGNPTRTELLSAELALTFGGSNITHKATGKLYINPEEEYVDKVEKIRKLPRALIVELALALNDYVSDWGAVREA